MAEIIPLPQAARPGESIQELLLEQRDVLVRVERVLENSHVRLEVLQDVLKESLGVQKEQLSMFVRQLENQEFADEEARREAARMRAGTIAGPTGATAEPATSGEIAGGISTALSAGLGAVAGGLAAGGIGAALRSLAGRLLRGGGLIAIGTIWGEQIGKFLGIESSAILEDLGVDPQFADQVGEAISNSAGTALIGGGISRLLLGRTLPGIIGGFIFNQLGLDRLFTEEGRDELTNGIAGWFERLRDGELTPEDIYYGGLTGAAAAYAGARAVQAGRAIGRRFGTFTPQGTVEGPGQAARPGARPAPIPGTFVRPRRPNGQFMSDAEIQDMYEQQIRDGRYRRVFRNVIRGLGVFGVVLTAGQALELYNILSAPDSDISPEAKRAAVGSFIGGLVGAGGGAAAGAAVGAFFGPWTALILGAIGAGVGGFAGGEVGQFIAAWAFDDEPPVYQTQEQYEEFIIQNRERFEAGPNVGIVEGVTVDPSGALQRTTPSFGQQFGFRRPAPQAGTGATAEPAIPEEIEVTPEQRAIVDQITGLMNDLEGLRVEEEVAREQYETRRGRDRRNAALRVENLTTQIENLEEEIESLRLLLDTGTRESLSDASVGVGTGQARIYNAALGTTMTVDTGPRPAQAALTPSFSEPRVIRASLGVQEPVSGSQDMTEDQRKALQVYSAFVQAGFSDSQARALVGEVYRENGFREQYWYGTHTDPANEATNAGIISWQGPRKTALYNYLGDRGLLNADGSMKPGYDTLVAQAEYLRYEMETGAGGGTRGQISRYQDWFRSEQVSPDESMRVLGQDFIRWRMNDPQYRESGIANIEYGRSQIDSLMLPSPDSQIAQAPARAAGGDIEAGRSSRPARTAGGDIEAGRSMLGSFSEAIQALSPTGFGFDALFGEGTFANILTSDNPEQMIANRLDSIFNRGGVATEAVQLNQSSEARTTAPIVINAPQINNDNSVTAGGGSSARTMASQERAIQPLTERSVASTLAEWWDATVA